MRSLVLRVSVCGAFFALACGASSESEPTQTVDCSAGECEDRIDPWSEDPSKLLPGASDRLRDVILAADVGETFGVPAERTPYPDTYWPFVDDGIDARWNGSEPSPLEKYMTLADPARKEAAQRWEKANHGSQVPGVQSWFGHCPGWTGSAMFNAPVVRAVSVKMQDGELTSCAADAAGCTKLEIGDLNALMAEVFVDGANGFLGARCDTAAGDIKRDAYGRIARDGSGCKGLNAGALMIVLAKRMKQDHQALAIDAQNDFNTDQIWNQPAYAYKVYGYRALSRADAIRAVAGRASAPRSYVWNRFAKSFVRVDVGISWVSERGPNTSVVSGQSSTRETRFSAILELSTEDPATARVVGGEYIDDATTGATRLTVPPFVWTAGGAGPETLATSANGNHHNPYVKPSIVTKLAQLGARP